MLSFLCAGVAALSASTSLPAEQVTTQQDTTMRLIAAAEAAGTLGQLAMEERARRLALTTGYAVEAMLLGRTAAALGRRDAIQRFADFVDHRLTLMI